MVVMLQIQPHDGGEISFAGACSDKSASRATGSCPAAESHGGGDVRCGPMLTKLLSTPAR